MPKDRFEVKESDNGIAGTLLPWSSHYHTTIRDSETGKTYEGRSEDSQAIATEKAERELSINLRHK